MFKKVSPLLAALVASVATTANAALPTAITTGLSTAQADMIELYGAMAAAGIAIFVVAILYNKFRIK